MVSLAGHVLLPQLGKFAHPRARVSGNPPTHVKYVQPSQCKGRAGATPRGDCPP